MTVFLYKWLLGYQNNSHVSNGLKHIPPEVFTFNKIFGKAHLIVMHCRPIAGGWWIAQGNGGIKGAHSSPTEHNKGDSTSCYMSLLIVLANKRDIGNTSLIHQSKIQNQKQESDIFLFFQQYNCPICHMIGTKPWPEPMLNYCQGKHIRDILIKFNISF